jgi:adenine-specific DNA-methyltransferase
VKTGEELSMQLTLHTDPVDENAKIENILYELLLKSGVPLTARIEEKDGYYCVNNGEIILILKQIDDSIIKTVISEKPEKVITLDRLFKNNDQLKTNTALQLKDAEIKFVVV